jgi:hypothetical protein
MTQQWTPSREMIRYSAENKAEMTAKDKLEAPKAFIEYVIEEKT